MTRIGNREVDLLDSLVTLRAVVAALGERVAQPWWRTQFLTEAGLRAVGRLFPRTAAAAAVRSTALAARSEHDRLIGIENRYHLFRLPTEFESSIDSQLSDPTREKALGTLLKGDADSLRAALKEISAGHSVTAGTGPTSIGRVEALRAGRAAAIFAAHYDAAFSQGRRWFPYVEARESTK